MLTVISFLVALGLLIAVHEYGHYRVAVACGVRVLRFSIGFGKVFYRWKPKQQKPGQDTEFVFSVFPIGGYVRMLDEREGPVPPELRHLAFNTQPLRSRAAIVAAGPLANLLLAVLLYAGVNWSGVSEPRALVASPVAGSIAERAGLRGGEEVLAMGNDGDELQPVRSFDDLRWRLTEAALNGQHLRLQLNSQPEPGASDAQTLGDDDAAQRRRLREVALDLSPLASSEADASLFNKIGIVAPWSRPVLGDIMPDGAAAKAGLHAGDLVLSLNGAAVVDAAQLRQLIRGSGQEAPTEQDWRVQRAGQLMHISVTPVQVQEGKLRVARIGAYVGAAPEMLSVRYGPLEGMGLAFRRTWDISALTLRMMGRMVLGQASLKNLSGPLSIADYAGKSASLGMSAYVLFLAMLSVSLGVLNLLPLPVLDGGHLMYYLWEALTGRGVSDAWLERLQRTGVAILLVMMSIAMFNDVTRLFG